MEGSFLPRSLLVDLVLRNTKFRVTRVTLLSPLTYIVIRITRFKVMRVTMLSCPAAVGSAGNGD
ncbi:MULTISPECIES: hypothetical protein [Prochlorococcus]|uniref:hypothetical protein n=1 Tax=Prochlorococcus TaxID=1218 RepID=UPI0007B328F3|nr:hypothetical protein [Prochlorococcus marinus]